MGEVGTAIKTYNYTYGNAWKDQLTAFDGQSIVYDAAGNPTSYLGKVLTWSKGRLLNQYVSGYTTIANQYDANGIRKNKARINTAPGVIGDIVSTSYLYGTDGKLVKESTQGYTRYYFYTQDGIVGYMENGEKFLYRKNLFGDIIAIYQGTNKVAEYTYDAWGNCTVTLDTNGYGTRNPFRYRGYYWDSDLNMYYLLTRYYDPKIGRFINADAPKYLQPKSINGLNLYAYCGNNPIMNVDPTGHEPTSTYLLMYGLFAIIFAAMYLVAKNTPAKPKNPSNNHEPENSDGELNALNWPVITIPFVSMFHETISIFESSSFGSFLGNISYTTTTQEGNGGLIYDFIDYGNNQINTGRGINLGGLLGISGYTSTNNSIGFNIQGASSISAGLELSLNDGLSVSGGFTAHNITHEISVTVGWGTIFAAGIVAAVAYMGRIGLVPVIA